jgi:hypothetical protein
VLSHLAVPDADLRLGHDLAQVAGDVVDALHAVVHEVDLSAAIQLAEDGLADQAFVELGHVGLDGQALLGRRVHRRHVADATQRHVQRPRDGRRRQREHIHLAPHLLQALLVGHAEALLFVDDDQAQVLELHVLLDESMRADDDVDRAVLQFGQHGGLPADRNREHLHSQEGGQALAEGLALLASTVVGTSIATCVPSSPPNAARMATSVLP